MDEVKTFTLRIAKEKGSTEFFEIKLKPMDKTLFLFIWDLIQQKKTFQAMEAIIANCWISEASGAQMKTIVDDWHLVFSGVDLTDARGRQHNVWGDTFPGRPPLAVDICTV